MKLSHEAMPDFVPERAVNLGIVRSVRDAGIDPTYRADHAIATIEAEIRSLLTTDGGVADELNLLIWKLLPVYVDFSVGGQGQGGQDNEDTHGT